MQACHIPLTNLGSLACLDLSETMMLLLYRVSHNLQCAIQVAQGVLDHMNSVLGSSEHEHRRSLQELLSLYAIATPSRQGTQGAVWAEACIHTACCSCSNLCQAVLCHASCFTALRS